MKKLETRPAYYPGGYYKIKISPRSRPSPGDLLYPNSFGFLIKSKYKRRAMFIFVEWIDQTSHIAKVKAIYGL